MTWIISSANSSFAIAKLLIVGTDEMVAGGSKI
jgi:hypothetical protein